MAPPRFDMAQFVSDFERAFNERSYDKVLKHYDPNVEFAIDSSGKTQRGVDAFRKLWETWADGFSETRLEVMQGVQDGADVAILQRCRARHTGDGFELTPGERLPATNRSVNLVVADFLRLDEQGRIVRDFPIMDVADLMRQLGVLPPASPDAGTRRAVQR